MPFFLIITHCSSQLLYGKSSYQAIDMLSSRENNMRGQWIVRILTILAVISLIYGISLQESTDLESTYGEEADSTETSNPPESDDGSDMIPESLKEEEPENNPGEESKGLKGKLIGFGSGFLSVIFFGSIFFEFFRIIVLMALLTPLLAKKESTKELTKGRILGYVEANAGIHFSALRDALKLANGVTAYHLQILEVQGAIISWRDGKLRRYATSNLTTNEINSITSPIVGTRLAILRVLSDAGALGLTNKEIGNKLEISRQLLSHHINKLNSNQLIEKSGVKKRSSWRLTEPGLEILNSTS